MNSTRRYGFEISIKNKIIDYATLISDLTYSKAKYTSENQGTYATDFKDNDVPLVPEYSIDTRLEINLSDFTTFTPSLKYQDDMRMESDDENFQDTKIPSQFLFDISISSKINKILSANLMINNLFNQKYHNYAVASSSTLGTYNAYPEPGRVITLSLSSKF